MALPEVPVVSDDEKFLVHHRRAGTMCNPVVGGPPVVFPRPAAEIGAPVALPEITVVGADKRFLVHHRRTGRTGDRRAAGSAVVHPDPFVTVSPELVQVAERSVEAADEQLEVEHGGAGGGQHAFILGENGDRRNLAAPNCATSIGRGSALVPIWSARRAPSHVRGRTPSL